jgi:putative phage-type endonuclease
MNYISTAGLTQEQINQIRVKYLGASEVGIILNFNRFRTPLNLWREKIQDPNYQPFTGNEFTEWGNRLENSIAQGFAARYNAQIFRDNKIRIAKNGITTCSLDRRIKMKGYQGTGILEVKNMSEYAFQALRKSKEDIPLTYYAQQQQQFYITGAEWGFFIMLIGGNRLEVKEMKPDPDYAQKQTDYAVAWWTDHVIHKERPKPVAEDITDPKSGLIIEGSKIVDETTFSFYETYMKASEQIKQLEKIKDENKELFMEAVGEAKTASYMECPIYSMSEYLQFNFKEFKEAKPKLYEKFKTLQIRKPSFKKFTYEEKETKLLNQ